MNANELKIKIGKISTAAGRANLKLYTNWQYEKYNNKKLNTILPRIVVIF